MDAKRLKDMGHDGVKKVTRTFRDVVVLVFKYFMYSFALAILYYIIPSSHSASIPIRKRPSGGRTSFLNAPMPT